MKRAPVFVLAGTVAGFLGVVGFHTRAATSAASPGSGGHVGRSGSAGHAGCAKCCL